ncbi:radical SAM/SPASM domain-containing protein [Candidatus Omnitrophota bacterium]
MKKKARIDATEQVCTVSFGEDINVFLGNILGKDFQKYRRCWEKATDFKLMTDYPIHIDFEMNYSCNLRCPMCVFGLPRSKRPYEPKQHIFSLEKAKEIIREGVPLGLRSICAGYYGEPLLRKGIIEFCNWAGKNGILDIIFVTNATLMTKEVSRAILDSKITRLRFSLDAVSKELYEKIRVGADYEDTYGNILEFLRLKKEKKLPLPVTSVNFVLMKTNEHELDDFKAFWKDKVDYVVIQQLVNINPDKTSKAERRRIARRFRCPQPFQRVEIRADGLVIPCCSGFGEKMPLGNVFKDSIKNMWKSYQEEHLREIHKKGEYFKDPICLKCASVSTAT